MLSSTIGNDLGSMPDKYAVLYDDVTKVYRVLDLKHPEIVKIQIKDVEDIDIPDDHPAMTVITEMAFVKLIADAIKRGILAESVTGIGSDVKDIHDLKREIVDKDLKIQELERALSQNRIDTRSEQYQLKSKVIDAVKQIALSGDICEIT